MEITTVGMDLAKNVFHVVGCNRGGKVIKKNKLTRAKLREFFTQLQPCVVAMEACGSAHYWGREISKMGHTVKLLPPHKVKPFINGQKNDYNDATGIAEAATREQIRGVSIKTVEQQDLQSLHRLREGCTKDRTALCNKIRGLLSEYGIVLPKGVSQLRNQLPGLLEDGENGLSYVFREWINKYYQKLLSLDDDLDYFNHQLKLINQTNEHCKRLEALPGFGPVVASAFVSHVGNGSAFKRGRDVSASIGLVPRQHSSGDKTVLLGITKRGNDYLRRLLVHGARSVVHYAKEKDDALSRWIKRISASRGVNKAAVALANKLARMAWAMIVNNAEYKPANT